MWVAEQKEEEFFKIHNAVASECIFLLQFLTFIPTTSIYFVFSHDFASKSQAPDVLKKAKAQSYPRDRLSVPSPTPVNSFGKFQGQRSLLLLAKNLNPTSGG